MKAITDHALGLLLDNETVAAHLEDSATLRLGRGQDVTSEDDPAWWQAKTDALNALLADMTALNTSSKAH